jgi:hypothetical protein
LPAASRPLGVIVVGTTDGIVPLRPVEKRTRM